jgi:hypothetical protein
MQFLILVFKFHHAREPFHTVVCHVHLHLHAVACHVCLHLCIGTCHVIHLLHHALHEEHGIIAGSWSGNGGLSCRQSLHSVGQGLHHGMHCVRHAWRIDDDREEREDEFLAVADSSQYSLGTSCGFH